MKLVLCRSCKGIGVPTKPMPVDDKIHLVPKGDSVGVCPCKKSAIMYSGKGNEVVVAGPATIIAILDDDWNSLLDPDDDTRRQFELWTVPRTASTVLYDDGD